MTKDLEPNNEGNTTPAPTATSRSGMGYVLFVIILAVVAIYGLRDQISKVFSKDNIELSASNSTFTQVQTEEIQKITKEYIESHPEAIISSLQNMEKKAMGEKLVKAQDYISKNISAIDSDKPYLGNNNASVVITKFFDYRCGHCKSAHNTIDRLIAAEPNLKVVLIETPVLGPQSLLAAKAALAAFKIDPTKFAQFNSKLFTLQDYTETSLGNLASSIGFNKAQFITTLNSPEIAKGIDTNLEIARNLQLQGVPAFIVGEEFIPGAIDYNALKAKIDALNTKPPTAAATAPTDINKAATPEEE